MTNRAADDPFHAGSDVISSQATLPAGIGGHVNAADFARFTATGEEPEHRQDQLDLYVDVAFKHRPWEQAQAEAEDGVEETSALVVPDGG
ncbi:hypothetical protein BRD56_06645 [Thermoplasmatales archaeon SW_10_69_26]|nr:MAG: hypothetical protein BRD56_06645 [Thermoplasmatales archaeon SW_10_69_26]